MSIFSWDDSIWNGDIIQSEIKCHGDKFKFYVEKGSEYFIFEFQYRGCEKMALKVYKDMIVNAHVRLAKLFTPGCILIRFAEEIKLSASFKTDKIMIRSSKNDYKFLVIYKLLECNGIGISC